MAKQIKQGEDARKALCALDNENRRRFLNEPSPPPRLIF